jgi:hypothetical protein
MSCSVDVVRALPAARDVPVSRNGALHRESAATNAIRDDRTVVQNGVAIGKYDVSSPGLRSGPLAMPISGVCANLARRALRPPPNLPFAPVDHQQVGRRILPATIRDSVVVNASRIAA